MIKRKLFFSILIFEYRIQLNVDMCGRSPILIFQSAFSFWASCTLTAQFLIFSDSQNSDVYCMVNAFNSLGIEANIIKSEKQLL